MSSASLPDFRSLWAGLAGIGRTPSGYHRLSWSEADLACRDWFTAQADARGLSVETDGNGNLWAWLGDPGAGDAVVTGSHLDSVPGGGGFDGPLGIASAFLALDVLRGRGVTPARPLGIVAFAEEEGSRFGIACLGSRLLCGDVDPARARGLRDRDGVPFPQAAGLDPDGIGPDPKRLANIAAFVELHIEQGRYLADVGSSNGTGAPVGVASGIWPHGRWRLDFAGAGNHAGTTRMADRRDPMLTFAFAVLAANKAARVRGGHATVGRVSVSPNATNAVPASVTAWLDARAADQSTLDTLVEDVLTRLAERAIRDGTTVTSVIESLSPTVGFDPALRDRIAALLGDAPILPTGAGHDAGVLAAHVPTAMLFVRNPTGISHAPDEHATDSDCAAGVTALADVLTELACS
jgi:beta-ureidopropionase / N-carbamoyl-L-amino-acid hydrolase